MNKLIKTIIAIFGATNVIFNVATPIMLSLAIITITHIGGFYTSMFVIAGIISTLYRALDVAFLR